MASSHTPANVRIRLDGPSDEARLASTASPCLSHARTAIGNTRRKCLEDPFSARLRPLRCPIASAMRYGKTLNRELRPCLTAASAVSARESQPLPAAASGSGIMVPLAGTLRQNDAAPTCGCHRRVFRYANDALTALAANGRRTAHCALRTAHCCVRIPLEQPQLLLGRPLKCHRMRYDRDLNSRVTMLGQK